MPAAISHYSVQLEADAVDVRKKKVTLSCSSVSVVLLRKLSKSSGCRKVGKQSVCRRRGRRRMMMMKASPKEGGEVSNSGHCHDYSQVHHLAGRFERFKDSISQRLSMTSPSLSQLLSFLKSGLTLTVCIFLPASSKRAENAQKYTHRHICLSFPANAKILASWPY